MVLFDLTRQSLDFSWGVSNTHLHTHTYTETRPVVPLKRYDTWPELHLQRYTLTLPYKLTPKHRIIAAELVTDNRLRDG